MVSAILAAAVLAGCSDEVPDYSGVWRFEAEHCRLEIEQEGDRVTIRSSSDDASWTCQGRGNVDGDVLHLRWAGTGKGWRGTATLRLEEGVLRGTYDIEGIAGPLPCEGRRVER